MSTIDEDAVALAVWTEPTRTLESGGGGDAFGGAVGEIVLAIWQHGTRELTSGGGTGSGGGGRRRVNAGLRHLLLQRARAGGRR